MPRKHIIITGTGRAGTTFLVQLLTTLGLDTGFNAANMPLYKNARAGLELDVRKNNAPFIVKCPKFCEYAEEVLQRDDIVIEHVFIPMRDLHAAAESRRQVVKNTLSELPLIKRIRLRKRPSEIDGGLIGTNNKHEQEEVLLQKIYKLILDLSLTFIPVTLLHYPRIVKDSSYLFNKLKPIIGDIDAEQFNSAFAMTLRPELINSFNQNDRYQSIGNRNYDAVPLASARPAGHE